MELTDEGIHKQLSLILERRDPNRAATVLGAGSDDLSGGREYLEKLVDGGWMVPTWPVEYGGRGATEGEARRISIALDRYESADLYPYGVGISLVGPVLLDWGTQGQRSRWLRAIADGSEIWCQMFSEPDAGSDLANIGTRAVRNGEEWVLTGSKLWTSRGTYSKWGMCLARTDPNQPKHRGLSMFVIDMEDSGVEVRPLEQVNGDRHFSQIFIAGVRISDCNRIGRLGDGWKVAIEMLAHERISLGGRAFGGSDTSEESVPGWLTSLASRGALDDPVFRDRALRLYVFDAVSRITAALNTQESSKRFPSSEGSKTKLRSVRAFKARAYLLKDVSGALGMLEDSPGHLEFLTAPSMSIRGGTDEVQRNIVADRLLGLPPEPRVDKDLPYSSNDPR